MYSLISSDLEL